MVGSRNLAGIPPDLDAARRNDQELESGVSNHLFSLHLFNMWESISSTNPTSFLNGQPLPFSGLCQVYTLNQARFRS